MPKNRPINDEDLKKVSGAGVTQTPTNQSGDTGSNTIPTKPTTGTGKKG
ncbi:MAG: hypothetical protein HYR85_27685 [Planctomycetes bacterium]|nr:hypothetical protein [Planctomycetota bacterium]MBI3844237.1 hypothetical protein [Planctomycetota bacterium]